MDYDQIVHSDKHNIIITESGRVDCSFAFHKTIYGMTSFGNVAVLCLKLSKSQHEQRQKRVGNLKLAKTTFIDVDGCSDIVQSFIDALDNLVVDGPLCVAIDDISVLMQLSNSNNSALNEYFRLCNYAKKKDGVIIMGMRLEKDSDPVLRSIIHTADKIISVSEVSTGKSKDFDGTVNI